MRIEVELKKLEKVQELINRLSENYDADHLGSIMIEIGLTSVNPSDIFETEITTTKAFYASLSNLENKLNKHNLVELEPEFEEILVKRFNELLEEDK